MLRRHLVLCLGVLGFLLSGCQADPTKGVASARSTAPLRVDVKAQLLWQENLASVEKATNGADVYGDSFERACLFFYEVSGITVPGNGSYAGWAPSKDTGTALPTLRAWYRENHARLYWDEASGSVKVRSP
jgi:hypothetical protein